MQQFKFLLTALFVVYTIINVENNNKQQSAVATSNLSKKIKVDQNFKIRTLQDWIKSCRDLPYNRQGANFTDTGFDIVSKESEKRAIEFEEVLTAWINNRREGSLSQKDYWTISNQGKQLPDASFFSHDTMSKSFTPYAEKLNLNPGDQVYFRGDLHGDIQSLIKQLQELFDDGVIDDNFKIIKDNVWFVCLGDYVDRGVYGLEVMYTLLRLSLANPDRVILVRGNHEDITINNNHIASGGGFHDEVVAKFGNKSTDILLKIISMYNLLPTVLYVGCKDTKLNVTNYLQCCHGGLEIGYYPQKFLDEVGTKYQMLGALHRSKMCASLELQVDDQLWLSDEYKVDNIVLKKPTNCGSLGFMWYDFLVQEKGSKVVQIPGRGLAFGKVSTQIVLSTLSSTQSQLRGVFRAHQHSSDPSDQMMIGLVKSNGIYKLWHPTERESVRYLHNGLVWTFNVAPDSVYGKNIKFNFDTYAKLTVQENYNQWFMNVYNTQVLDKDL